MTTPDNPPSETAPPTTQQTPPDATQTEPSANSEAARWRVKLREVEAERDTLAERVTALQRRECEAVVAELLAQPADLWDIGQADVNVYYNEDGTVDEEELRSSAAALLDMRPGLAKSAKIEPEPKQWGQYGGMPAPRVGWESVISKG